MKFCPDCGSKNESGDLFCSTCGFKLSNEKKNIEEPVIEKKENTFNSNYRLTVHEFAQKIREQFPNDYDELSDYQLVSLWLKKYPTDSNKVILDSVLLQNENKSKKNWYWIGAFLLFFLIIVSYGLYKDSIYPKTETELNNLLCDKFWKISEIEVQEIYFNDNLVPKPTSNVVKNLERSINGDNKEQYYNLFKETLEKQRNYDTYESFSMTHKQCSETGKIWHYEQSYNTDLTELTYSTSCISLYKQGDRYVYDNQNELTFRVGSGEMVENKNSIISEQMKIEEISTNSLKVLDDATFFMDGFKYRIVGKTTYTICSPMNTTRYEEEKK